MINGSAIQATINASRIFSWIDVVWYYEMVGLKSNRHDLRKL
jgi:hypothetical protein